MIQRIKRRTIESEAGRFVNRVAESGANFVAGRTIRGTTISHRSPSRGVERRFQVTGKRKLMGLHVVEEL